MRRQVGCTRPRGWVEHRGKSHRRHSACVGPGDCVDDVVREYLTAAAVAGLGANDSFKNRWVFGRAEWYRLHTAPAACRQGFYRGEVAGLCHSAEGPGAHEEC